VTAINTAVKPHQIANSLILVSSIPQNSIGIR